MAKYHAIRRLIKLYSSVGVVAGDADLFRFIYTVVGAVFGGRSYKLRRYTDQHKGKS